MPPLRIGIVLMSALGDITLGLPVLMAIRRAWPDARITWVVQRGHDALLRGHQGIDELVPFDRWTGLSGYLGIHERLRTRSFDLVIDLQTALKAGIVTAMMRADAKIGFDRPRCRDANWLFTNHRIPTAPRAHMADQFREFLPAIGIDDPSVEYGLTPSADAHEAVTNAVGADPRPLCSIVVASSKAYKNWSPARLGALCIELVQQYGVRPVLVGGLSDVEQWAAADILRQCAMSLAAYDRPLVALGCGIPQLLAFLDRSALVVSPDSGPLHMAVALDRPVVGLYGATNPQVVGPYRRSADLVVDRYHAPGETPRFSVRRRLDGMQRIGVDDVLERVDYWRRAYAPEPMAATSRESVAV
jgi:heptosyltransferase I